MGDGPRSRGLVGLPTRLEFLGTGCPASRAFRDAGERHRHRGPRDRIHTKNKGAPPFHVLCGKVGDGNPIRLPFRLSQLPNLLGINQPADFRMERRADMYISTLQSMIRTMGGS